MINFRFHLVSLTAVFLALALGVLMGSTVIERGIVDTLNNRIEAVNRRAEGAEAENARLGRELGRREEVAAATSSVLLTGRLADVPVVVVAIRGTSEEQVTQLRDTLAQAGAAVVGPVWINERWNLAERDEDLAALSAAVDIDVPSSVGAVRREALTALAGALRGGAEPDVLARLRDSRFVDIDGNDGDDLVIPAEARFVVVSDARAQVPSAAVAVPLVEALVALEAVVVAAEPLRTIDDEEVRTSFVGPLREGAVGGNVTTVDDLEAIAGRIAIVAALEEPVARQGHYGVGEDAERLLPELAPA